MSTSTSARRTSNHASTIVGIVVGVLLLGLVAAFAIGLPKAAGAEEGEAQVELSLPDTLPGGYMAADLADSFADGELAKQADQIAKQQAESTKYGNEVLPEVLGHPAVTRSYVIDGSKAVFVQVFAAEGGALAPNSLTDPSTTGGAGGLTMENIAGAACVLGYGQSQDGSVGDPTSTQCQLSEGGLTVQTQSNQVGAEALADLSREILAGYDQ